MPLLSTASRIAFSIAANEAQALNHKLIDIEHLFLGLCKIEDIPSLGKKVIPQIDDLEWQDVCRDIQEFRNFYSAKGIDCKKSRRSLRKILSESDVEKGDFSGHRTQWCKEAFIIAERLSRDAGEVKIYPEQMLLAVLSLPSPFLDILFSELAVKKDDFIKGTGEKSITVSKTKTPFLDKFGRDLTQLARDGKLNPTIGRKEEMRKVAQILVQKKKNNPMLVGDTGVGKTCIVEGLARKFLEPEAPPGIRNFRIIELSMVSLVAGTKHRGEFEERLELLIGEASSDPDIVLFIDEIHTIVGAGATGNAMDAGNILKPALARGTIKCIGATTTSEYRKYIEKDTALERRFQLVWVDEPTKEETVLILKGLRQKFEEYHGLKIPDMVIEKAVELSIRYLPDFRLPDKAIDIIDQSCARKILKTISPVESKKEKALYEVNIEDIACVVSERCRIPVESLTVEESERLLKMEEQLQKVVIGQDHAIREVAETIRYAKAGLKDQRKPVGIFLFLGSTGTGKTELAKALAEFLFHDEKRLIVFDMSEYQEKHSIAKLLGAPPGYIGYDEEGQLTSKARTNPHSVILFDEIEKAHPEIFNIFLQIFDEGRLTDAHGRRANFSESVIILTSNLGGDLSVIKRPIGVDIEKNKNDSAETISLKGVGEIIQDKNICDPHEKWKSFENQIFETINRTFRPEFLNRIQKKIIFYPLGKETVRRIVVEKILTDLNQRLSPKGIQIALSDSALVFLINKGYNESYGARDMQRTFEHYISEPLSHMILKGEVKLGDCVNVSGTSEKIFFHMNV